jgi:hypothetical protein
MKTKHTQGEWETQGTAVFSNNKLVANCVSDGIHFTEEDKANAKLIAAAPELLEALIEAVGHIDSTFYPELKQKINNAINRATL